MSNWKCIGDFVSYHQDEVRRGLLPDHVGYALAALGEAVDYLATLDRSACEPDAINMELEDLLAILNRDES